MNLVTLRNAPALLPGVMAALLVPVGPASAVDLETCVIEALGLNPDIEETAHRVEEARALADQARAAYYPLLYTSADYARTDNAPQAFMMTLNQRNLDFDTDFNHPDDTDNLRVTLGIKYLVTDGGRRSLTRRMADQGGEVAAAQRRAAANELIHAVTKGYYGVLQARALVGVQEEQLRSLEESLRVARERFDAGSAVRTDVLNLEVRLAQAREDLIRATHATELAVAALNTSIGRPLVTQADVEQLAAPAEPDIPSQAAASGVEEHPALSARRAETQAAEMNRTRSNRAYAPSLYLFGTSDWDNDLSSGFEDSYFAGVSAEWDLFTGFSRGASNRGAEARLRGARAREASVRNHLELALTQARLASADAKERLEVTADGERRGSAAHHPGALRNRARPTSPNCSAQFGLTETRTRNVTARNDCLVALSDLELPRARCSTGTPNIFRQRIISGGRGGPNHENQANELLIRPASLRQVFVFAAVLVVFMASGIGRDEIQGRTRHGAVHAWRRDPRGARPTGWRWRRCRTASTWWGRWPRRNRFTPAPRVSAYVKKVHAPPAGTWARTICW